MDARDILRRIDEGANHFLHTLADGPHMTCTDADGFTVIQPKAGEAGVSFVCDLALEGLCQEDARTLIDRAKHVGFPVWFPLLSTDEQFAYFFGRERIHGAALAADDEVYMAMLPGEMIDVPPRFPVMRVESFAAFADCAHVVNTVLAGGRPDLHPIHHEHLMLSGRIRCHVLYNEGRPISAAVTMSQDGVASLELVATLPEYRHRGYAEAVCRQAVQDEWLRGAMLLTVRAVNSAAARIYERLGFHAYNDAL